MCRKSFSAVQQKYPGGCSAPMESSSLPFLLSRIGLAITVPLFAHLRRSALQPPSQCTATAPAVHCIRPCSALHPPHTCNLSRKYLQPSLHVLATAPASTCGKRRHYLGSLPLPLQSLSPVFWHTAVQAAESCAWVSYVMRTGARRGSSKIIPIWEDPLSAGSLQRNQTACVPQMLLPWCDERQE